MQKMHFRDVDNVIHDYAQAYVGTFARTWIEEEGPHLCYHIRCIDDDGDRLTDVEVISPGGQSQGVRRHSILDLEMDAQPPRLGWVRLRRGSSPPHTYLLTRPLARVWKRGLQMDRLGFFPHQAMTSALQRRVMASVFYPKEYDWREDIEDAKLEAKRLMRELGSVDHTSIGTAVTNEIALLQNFETRFTDFFYMYWYNRLVGWYNTRTHRAAVVGECEYLAPKLMDHFGEIDVY